MTTGPNKDNPYGEYVPGQYSQGSEPLAPSQGTDATASYSTDTPGAASTPDYSTPASTGYGTTSGAYGTSSYDANSYAGSPAYSGYGAAAGYGYGFDSAPKPKGLAVASLVLGILAFLSGWALIGGLFGIVGLILGIMGIKRANRGEAEGKGLAIAGIVTSSLGLIGALVAAVFWGWITTLAIQCADQPNEYAVQQCIDEKTGMSTYDEGIDS
ncbi:DUF4190 domain-containing protein [Rothia nasimurium]|uniref:DUF4190 domain-containing protein n=1 Tax=Rothia nasimurium TaxID=85336 RepID=UPI001F2F3C48|nr:DUF4190 domain-containing protein [Rothia nasimurium]